MKPGSAAALVTGGGKRVGAEIARALARAGYDIAIHYSSSVKGAEETRAAVEAEGRRAALLPADLSSPAETAKLIPAALDALPHLNVLINSAGVFKPGRLVDTDDALFDHHMQINFKTPVFLTRDFARLLPAGVQGHVINIIDMKVMQEVSGYFAYSLSKKALFAFTRLAARDLGPRIRVNGVCPGDVLPPPGGTEEFLVRRAESLPLKMRGRPEYVAAGVVSLLESPFTTGQCLFVDGGEHLLVGDPHAEI